MSGGTKKRKADDISPGGEEDEGLLVDLTGEDEAETPVPFEAVQAASSWMKRPDDQAELERIAARGMLEGALQTLGLLEAVEQLLRERREEEAVRKAEEAERAVQEEQHRLREVESAALVQSAEMPGATTTTWKFEEPATMVPHEHFWKPLDYVCDATSDVNVVDEADEAGIPEREFEANAKLAEFGRTHDDFWRHVLWMLNAVATMTMVAADGRWFARNKGRKAIQVGC
ncbi:hypothetical protein DYB32_007324 [Aphanomyces invadans]|uniref:Uncharacterized protein n=1 Tax=Aphanomyces invadans TaxID=157072 RepID=A0A3R6Z0K6_9STRA|nr:hypothetical protein DYB32_007324 [Aphanomyces invadans]